MCIGFDASCIAICCTSAAAVTATVGRIASSSGLSSSIAHATFAHLQLVVRQEIDCAANLASLATCR